MFSIMVYQRIIDMYVFFYLVEFMVSKYTWIGLLIVIYQVLHEKDASLS
jgi:hypothetical protein